MKRLVSPSKLCTSQTKYSSRQCQGRTRPPPLPLLVVHSSPVYRGVRELSWYRSRRATPSSIMKASPQTAMSVKGTPSISMEGWGIEYLPTQLTLSVYRRLLLLRTPWAPSDLFWSIATLPFLRYGFQNNTPLISGFAFSCSRSLGLSGGLSCRASHMLARLQLFRQSQLSRWLPVLLELRRSRSDLHVHVRLQQALSSRLRLPPVWVILQLLLHC